MSEQATAVAESNGDGFDPHREAWGALARTHAAVTGRLQEALTAADCRRCPGSRCWRRSPRPRSSG